MEKVKRYSFNKSTTCGCGCTSREESEGEYVKFSDIKHIVEKTAKKNGCAPQIAEILLEIATNPEEYKPGQITSLLEACALQLRAM